MSSAMSGEPAPHRYMNPRPHKGKPYVPTEVEHRANIYTHGLFVLPSLFALRLLVYLSHTTSHVWISWVYGIALIMVFTSSTAFHIVCYMGINGRLKRFCHLGDRAVIYILIAASYTPWMVLKKHGMSDIIWLTWLATLCCVVYQFSFHDRFAWLEIVFYLALGICPAIFLTEMHDAEEMMEVAASGGIVISGIIFFKADGVIPFAHAIWHCFVTAGAAYHYYAVLKYLYPIKSLISANLTLLHEADSPVEENLL